MHCGGAREVHQIGEGHVPSMPNCSEVEAHWQMMFADDVVLCAREKDLLELELEPRREALEKRGIKVSRAKTEYMCLNETPLGAICLAVTGHRIQISRKHPAERW